jgi:hypothetical protein
MNSEADLSIPEPNPENSKRDSKETIYKRITRYNLR